MQWLIRAILRAFIWRGVYKLTSPRRKPRKSNRPDWE